jgi:hypothetical protein
MSIEIIVLKNMPFNVQLKILSNLDACLDKGRKYYPITQILINVLHKLMFPSNHDDQEYISII